MEPTNAAVVDALVRLKALALEASPSVWPTFKAARPLRPNLRLAYLAPPAIGMGTRLSNMHVNMNSTHAPSIQKPVPHKFENIFSI